jgi:hypothetical protein
MDAYRRFIDEMLDLARRNVTAERIRTQGHAERPNWREVPLPDADRRRLEFLLSLDEEQRAMVAGLLERERIAAVHDVLAHLDWKASADALLLGDIDAWYSDVASETFHGDFMARLEAR